MAVQISGPGLPGPQGNPGPTGPQGVFTGAEKLVAVGNVSGAVTLDLSQGSCFTLTLTGNTVVTFTNLQANTVNYATLRVSQDSQSTAWTLDITGRKGSFGANALANLSGTPLATDVVACASWNGTNWDVALVMQSVS